VKDAGAVKAIENAMTPNHVGVGEKSLSTVTAPFTIFSASVLLFATACAELSTSADKAS
jgi:hypothetical protein